MSGSCPPEPFGFRFRADAVELARKRHRRGTSSLSQLLFRAYRFRRLQEFVLRLCRRLEGDAFHSATLRRILRAYHEVEIGPYSYGSILRPGVLPPGSRVGAYCSVGAELIVRRRNHPHQGPFMHPFFYNSALGFLECEAIPPVRENPLQIGNDVWIGDRVTILSGCRSIGNGAVVGAGAVVTRDVEPYSIVAGVPARLIGKRFSDEVVAGIEMSRWWERDIADVIGALKDEGGLLRLQSDAWQSVGARKGEDSGTSTLQNARDRDRSLG